MRRAREEELLPPLFSPLANENLEEEMTGGKSQERGEERRGEEMMTPSEGEWNQGVQTTGVPQKREPHKKYP